MLISFEMLISFDIPISFGILISPFCFLEVRLKPAYLIRFVFVSKQRIELDPSHVGFGDIGDMASCTLIHRRFPSGRLIWQWMMPEGEEAPAIGLSKPLAVFHCYVDAVELAVEIPPSGWLRTGAVWKSRIQNPSQFFYNDCSFGKGARLQIYIDILLFDVYVVIFGEPCLSIV